MGFLIFLGILVFVFMIVGAVKGETASEKVVDVSKKNIDSIKREEEGVLNPFQDELDRIREERAECQKQLEEKLEWQRKYNEAAEEYEDLMKQMDIINQIIDPDPPVSSEEKQSIIQNTPDNQSVGKSDIFHDNFVFKVKGTFYRSQREISEARSLDKGDTLILQTEQNNKFSNSAVQVLSINGICIGYVEKAYSRIVSENIDRIKTCRVVRVSSHEVPYIDGEICFSENKCLQPSIIPKEFQISPEDNMNNMASGNFIHSDYRQIGIAVTGVYEQSREAIAKARNLRQGDNLILKKIEPTKYFPYRIDVYTEDDTMLGFLYPHRLKSLYENFDKIIRVAVDSPLDSCGSASLFIRIFFPNGICLHDDYCIGPHYIGSYPQLQEANVLKRTDPASALDIALKIADIEKGIDAKFLCCQCYRILKDYESEEKMILSIIDTIDRLTTDDYDPHECIILKNRKKPEMEKRLSVVRSRINSRNRKK